MVEESLRREEEEVRKAHKECAESR